jgi:hypothetical protein
VTRSKVTSKGQTSERLVVEVRERTESLVGALRHLAKDRPVTVEEMKSAVRRRAAERIERTRSE